MSSLDEAWQMFAAATSKNKKGNGNVAAANQMYALTYSTHGPVVPVEEQHIILSPLDDVVVAKRIKREHEFAADGKTQTTATINEANDDKMPLLLPSCTPLYISTKTKISFLNKPIELAKVFWAIPITPYYLPEAGVVKKQMKFVSLTPEAVNAVLHEKQRYLQEAYVDDYELSHVVNPAGLVPFKNVRKISIGLGRKDITSFRGKKKSAFYNCFVVILRLMQHNVFKEFHVKVFNTGKLEIPGIQDDATLAGILDLLTAVLAPIVDNVPAEEVAAETAQELATGPAQELATGPTQELATGPAQELATGPAQELAFGLGPTQELAFGLGPTQELGPTPLAYLPDKTYTVLINSNFSSGYYINRERFHHLLKYKYRINSNYDPCSYPGIQCEFHYDELMQLQNGMQPTLERTQNRVASNVCKVSFMVFRTGSVLIVGKCTEEILYKIYDFLCQIFTDEFADINVVTDGRLVVPDRVKMVKKKVRKMRKMTTAVAAKGTEGTDGAKGTEGTDGAKGTEGAVKNEQVTTSL
jgi:hypothetical protein